MPLTSTVSDDFSGSKNLALFDSVVNAATFQTFETVGGTAGQGTGELVIDPTDSTNNYNGYSTRDDLGLELDTAYATLVQATLPYGVFNGALATFAIGHVDFRQAHWMAFQIESVGGGVLQLRCEWNYFGATGDAVSVTYDHEVHGKFRGVDTGSTILWQYCGPEDDPTDEGSWTTLRDLIVDGASPPDYHALDDCVISMTGQNYGNVTGVEVIWDNFNTPGGAPPAADGAGPLVGAIPLKSKLQGLVQ